MFRNKPLPLGYKFTEGSEISGEEAVHLWQQAEHVYGASDTALVEWDETVQSAMLILGVRDRRRNLVGMGTITGDLVLGWLNHLAVHPTHRHLGIGRTILKERVKIADSIDVRVLATSLTSRNTLKPLYFQLGFQAVNDRGDILERESPLDRTLSAPS